MSSFTSFTASQITGEVVSLTNLEIADGDSEGKLREILGSPALSSIISLVSCTMGLKESGLWRNNRRRGAEMRLAVPRWSGRRRRGGGASEEGCAPATVGTSFS